MIVAIIFLGVILTFLLTTYIVFIFGETTGVLEEFTIKDNYVWAFKSMFYRDIDIDAWHENQMKKNIRKLARNVTKKNRKDSKDRDEVIKTLNKIIKRQNKYIVNNNKNNITCIPLNDTICGKDYNTSIKYVFELHTYSDTNFKKYYYPFKKWLLEDPQRYKDYLFLKEKNHTVKILSLFDSFYDARIGNKIRYKNPSCNWGLGDSHYGFNDSDIDFWDLL